MGSAAGPVHLINLAPRKQTHKPDLALSQFVAKQTSTEERVLRRVIGRQVCACSQGTRLRNSARVGSSIWKVEPLPSVDSTQMRPPCISTICLAMARPRPVPPWALVRELSI